MFRALAHCQRDWRNCGLCVGLYTKSGAMLLVGVWWRENMNKLVEWRGLVDTVGIKSVKWCPQYQRVLFIPLIYSCFEELSCGECYVIDQSRRQKVTSLCLSGWNSVQLQAKKEKRKAQKRCFIQKKPSPLTHKKSWPLTLNQLKAQ